MTRKSLIVFPCLSPAPCEYLHAPGPGNEWRVHMKNLHDLSKPHFLSELGGPLYMVFHNTAICLYVSLQFCKLKIFFGLTVSLDACIYACLYLVFILYFVLCSPYLDLSVHCGNGCIFCRDAVLPLARTKCSGLELHETSFCLFCPICVGG